MHFFKGIFCHSVLGALVCHNNKNAISCKDDYIELVEGVKKEQRRDTNGKLLFVDEDGCSTTINTSKSLMKDVTVGNGIYNIEANFLTFLNVTTNHEVKEVE